MRFDEHFLRGALSEATLVHATFPREINFSVDSRTLVEGDIFVPIVGKTADGHAFVRQALERGAAGIFINEDKRSVLDELDKRMYEKKLVVVVPDTLHALTRLAAAWRDQFSYPVVAVTGSVGKTSTKELIAKILTHNNAKHVASRGNQNTRIGLSLNMLRMRSDHAAAVFEVGINKRGEMRKLAQMLKPTTAVITNIGHSHMEGLGSLADIAQEKRELFHYFTEESIGIINGDQAILAQVGYVHPVIKFGSKTTNQIQARKIRIDKDVRFILKIYGDKYEVTLPAMHEGAVNNCLAAVAVAQLLKVPHSVILKAISEPLVIAGRFEVCTLDKGTLINDAYNANPESMKAALLAFEKYACQGPKIAVLGDMLELGVNSPFWHRQLGRFLRKVPSLSHVILVGSMVKWTRKTLPINISYDCVPTWQEAVSKLREKTKRSSLVLVKGSLGTGLLNLVDAVALDKSSDQAWKNKKQAYVTNPSS